MAKIKYLLLLVLLLLSSSSFQKKRSLFEKEANIIKVLLLALIIIINIIHPFSKKASPIWKSYTDRNLPKIAIAICIKMRAFSSCIINQIYSYKNNKMI